MPYIHGNGINLFYEDIGVGEPLIFLHGSFSRGIISFSAQMMDFQSDYRCIFPDLRGHGRTVTDDLNWDLPDLADDIIWLMDQLHIQTASVIGFSLGGYLAYYCASRYPERFKVMISIGSNANYNDDTRNSAIEFKPENLIKNGETKFIESMKANHFEAHRGNWERFLNQILYNWEKYCYIADENLRKIQIPCLLIVGDNDQGILDEELERLNNLVRNIQIVKMEGCGHGPHLIFEKPLDVNKIMKKFLAQFV